MKSLAVVYIRSTKIAIFLVQNDKTNLAPNFIEYLHEHDRGIHCRFDDVIWRLTTLIKSLDSFLRRINLVIQCCNIIFFYFTICLPEQIVLGTFAVNDVEDSLLVVVIVVTLQTLA